MSPNNAHKTPISQIQCYRKNCALWRHRIESNESRAGRCVNIKLVINCRSEADTVGHKKTQCFNYIHKLIHDPSQSILLSQHFVPPKMKSEHLFTDRSIYTTQFPGSPVEMKYTKTTEIPKAIRASAETKSLGLNIRRCFAHYMAQIWRYMRNTQPPTLW